MLRRKAVKLYWWRWQYPERLNFGDELTTPLVEHITGRRVVWASPRECDLVGAGSVLQKVIHLRKGASLPQFWGTGFIRSSEADEPLHDVPALAVRGRLTLERLAPAASSRVRLGDPGLLTDLLLKKRKITKHALGIVPHYKDVDSPVFAALESLGKPVHRIDVTLTPAQVAAEIASCEAVVSSSLHGLIVSDSLGVPNVHLPVGDGVVGGTYKFRDYYSAFENRPYRALLPEDVVGTSLDDTMRKLHENASVPEGIDELKQGLVDALTEANI